MDIHYSHIVEPLRKGQTLAQVFEVFKEKIEKAELKEEEKAEAYTKLRSALSYAWSEVRPVALTARNVKAKEDQSEKPEPPCNHDRY